MARKKQEARPPTAPPPGFDPFARPVLSPGATDRRLAEVLAEAETLRPSWFDRAACRGMGPELFFPPRRSGAEAAAAAKAICDRCPVAAPCLAAAIEFDDRDGVRAGLTPRERRSEGHRAA